MTSAISETRNFRALGTTLLTSGQPNEDQLADAARQGCTVVINLALHDDPRYSLRDEPATVRDLGMQYIHIPVQFANPTEENLLAFCAAMDTHGRREDARPLRGELPGNCVRRALPHHPQRMAAGRSMGADAFGVAAGPGLDDVHR
jgi:hypothetical protein